MQEAHRYTLDNERRYLETLRSNPNHPLNLYLQVSKIPTEKTSSTVGSISSCTENAATHALA
jgi:hypothetical protein